MANLEKLKQDVLETRKKSNMTEFSDVLGTYLGVKPKPFYKKVKDSTGNNILDDSGKPLREENSSGYTYTFSEVGTSKIVKIVIPKIIDLDLLGVYKLSGLGYDIRQSSLIFIQEKGVIKYYE